MRILISAVIAPLLLLAGCDGGANNGKTGEVKLLNVSYDPTRELWTEINGAFAAQREADGKPKVELEMSHGGSSSQARAVIDGLDADVVTLALWSDTDAIRKAGLIADDWNTRLPNGSLPYYSTIVFVVRKGNPKQIKDWPDLIKDGVAVITPNPKTSGNGKLSFLSAWGATIKRGGDEKAAQEFVTELYKRVPVLDTGARGATTTFAQKGIGDVHLTWENEAHLEVQESKGELEIVYPTSSIKAEPRVAWVDANVKRHGTEEIAKEYLEFLYTDKAQEIIAKNYYRPIRPEILHQHAKQFQPIELFEIQDVAKDWGDADARFFAEGAVFDQIYQPKGQ